MLLLLNRLQIHCRLQTKIMLKVRIWKSFGNFLKSQAGSSRIERRSARKIDTMNGPSRKYLRPIRQRRRWHGRFSLSLSLKCVSGKNYALLCHVSFPLDTWRWEKRSPFIFCYMKDCLPFTVDLFQHILFTVFLAFLSLICFMWWFIPWKFLEEKKEGAVDLWSEEKSWWIILVMQGSKRLTRIWRL